MAPSATWEAPAHDFDLRAYLNIIWRRKWVVLLTVVLAVGTVLFLSLRATAVYESSSDLLFRPSASESFFGSTLNFDAARSIENEVRLASSDAVHREVTKTLGRDVSVSASAPDESADVVALSTTGRDAKQVARDVNDFARVYVKYRQTQAIENLAEVQEQLQSQITSLQSQVDVISAPIVALDEQIVTASGDELTNLQAQRQGLEDRLAPQLTPLRNQLAIYQQQLDQAQLSTNLSSGGVELLRAATVPSEPVSPQPIRDATVAALLGLLLGIGLTFAVDQLDESIRTREQLVRATDGLPVLGLVPAATSWKNRREPYCVTMAEPASNAAEAYRSLRTAVKFLDIEQPTRVIEITSMTAAEGKTTTVANLAVALAQAGDRVVIADCDLRRPRVHTFLGVDNAQGLTSVLLGDVELEDVIRPAPHLENLAVLPSGPLPPNPSELLTWSSTGKLVRSLLTWFDYVLVDTPPLLPVTDALVVSAFVDATLVVATRRVSKRREAHRAIELLRQVDAPVVGTIFNGVSGDSTYATSGYAYYSQQTPPGEPEPTQKPRWRRRDRASQVEATK